MKFVSYAQNLHDLSVLKESGVREVILGHADYSRFGSLTDSEYEVLVKRCRELDLRILFEWDILMTQKVLEKLTDKVLPLLETCDAVRVQDPGALRFVLHHCQKPVQFIAENGNHNLPALEGWIACARGRMERLVLSLELPRDVIEEYCRKLPVPCELLGFGRILLFYSPRSLLSPLRPEVGEVQESLSAIGESEESPHKGFPVLENRHGTFMFHIKEFCLVEFSRDLSLMGLGAFRIDLRWSGLSWMRGLKSLLDDFSAEAFENFKASYPEDLMRGFYLVNKTDVLFPKLKNHRLQKREGNYLGEVLEAEKGSHLAIMVKNQRGLERTDRLRIVHPEGKEFEIILHSLKDLTMKEQVRVPEGKLALIPFVGGVWVKSQVFYLP